MSWLGDARHSRTKVTMGDKMITGPAFLILTFNYGKSDRDPVKDPRIPGKFQTWTGIFFLAELILVFFFFDIR